MKPHHQCVVEFAALNPPFLLHSSQSSRAIDFEIREGDRETRFGELKN